MTSEQGLPRTASDIPCPPSLLSPTSPALWHQLYAFKACQIVVSIVHYAVGKLRLLPRHLAVGNEAQQVADAIEARLPLVVRTDDIPRCEVCIGRSKHRVARPRMLEPFAARAQIRRAQLPLPQRILDTG